MTIPSTPPSSPIRIWIVDDHRNFRKEVISMVSDTADIKCVADFGSVERMIKHIETTPDLEVPRVVLMDVRLTGKSGIEGAQYLNEKVPDTNIVMLTLHQDAEIIYNALKAGAIGYLLKGMTVNQTLTAIRQAAQGVMMMPEQVAKKVRHFFSKLPDEADHNLTARELDVLEKMCDGLSQKDMAEALFISTNTVSQHIRSIYVKLQVNTRAGAVAKALRKRIVR